jgi:hypothetical protein
MSSVGATGKNASVFLTEISQNNLANNSSGSNTSATMDDISDRFRKNAAIAARNKYREDRRAIEGLEGDISDNEELNIDHEEIGIEHNEEPEVEEDDEFAAIQNLSASDFKKVISFSLKNAAEAATIISSEKSAAPISASTTSKSVPFDRHAIVFKEADEISGEVIPRQEIPDCIWKLVQARVPLSLPCITTSAIRYILNNPTSIKTTKSADGVSQSKELMLDMSAFGAPEDITQSDWQDAWINRLEIYKQSSEKSIYKYFKAHKKYISQQEDFSEKFEAYKRFDIYFCRHYNNTRFKMNPQQYSAKILEFKLEFSPSSIATKALPQSNTFRPSQTSRSSNRYEPYDRSKASGSGSSFPKGTNSGAQSGQCLICGRLGHRGSNCSFTTTEKGIPVVACWKNGRVVVIATGAEPCFQWNLRADCKNNHRTSDHFCSVCGSKNHTLSSRKCL